jgi:hypothetical protein
MLVQINAHVYSYYEHQCPIYRFWINDNLYNEREFWTDCLTNYIEEEMHVELEPGEHIFTIEKIKPPAYSKIWVEKLILNYNGIIKEMNFPVKPQNKQIIKFKIE